MELEQLAQYISIQTPKAWVNCYEAYEENSALLSFVFKVGASAELDYSTLPEASSLRRALKQRLLNGEMLHSALGYFTV